MGENKYYTKEDFLAFTKWFSWLRRDSDGILQGEDTTTEVALDYWELNIKRKFGKPIVVSVLENILVEEKLKTL